jgi:hypothetical protein
MDGLQRLAERFVGTPLARFRERHQQGTGGHPLRLRLGRRTHLRKSIHGTKSHNIGRPLFSSCSRFLYPQCTSTAILTRDLQAVASSLLRSCDGMSAVGGSGHYITGAGELLGPGVAKRPGPPIRTRSRARNQQEENYVALPATPIPMRPVISAARPGRLIHDPDKDAERCRAAWGRAWRGARIM